MNLTTLNGQYDNTLVSSIFGFLRMPLNFKPYESDAEWVITGVPFDFATSGRPGTRFGPDSIRRISANLAWEGIRFPWDFKLTDKLKIIDCGDLIFTYGDNEDFVQKMEYHASELLKRGKRMLTFGGDHFITLPLLRSHYKQFGQMALVHFDAHSDTYEQGSRYDHGTMFYHAPKEGLISAKHSIQIGIRTEYDSSLPFTVLTAPEANELAVEAIIKKIKEVSNGLPVYLTFDIDCLDPAYAPGTGTPVCGGFSTDKALKIIRGLKCLNIVGMDIVEVSPSYDHGDITSLAAATLALDMLYLQASKK